MAARIVRAGGGMHDPQSATAGLMATMLGELMRHAVDDNDPVAVATCNGYASLAAESALELEAERSAIRIEREQTAQFHQEMLRIVGHDLRAPIAAILIGTEMLAIDSQTPEAAYVRRIASFAKRMTRMVDQVLDMTRSRLGGGIPLVRSKARLSPLINSVMADLTLVHAGSRFELVAAAEIRGLWDVDRLGQLVSSLLTNAVQYGREGAPITVEVSQSETNAKITVHNEVRDHPIPPEALATLFEPYRRCSEHEIVGTGLGLCLFIVREIVRAHGGTLSVESSLTGTTFQVVLPGAVAIKEP